LNLKKSNPMKKLHQTYCLYNILMSQNYVTVQEQNVVIETVKQAERSEHTVIRLYECYNRRCDITLTVDADFTEAWESDLLERPETKLKTDGTTIYARIKPYEIKTIILK
ncbi:MAG: hypothetical protein HFI65_04665, partial [Lachnospiraceae bacterium]|nr:hypothetical protein [Lachnospiraceae bacterium]